MKINQRDIVEIAFYTGNKPEVHPAVVVSIDDIFEVEGFFYAVLLSTKNLFPDFTLR
jgi:isopenicillin N synthase-like dioxygenase